MFEACGANAQRIAYKIIVQLDIEAVALANYSHPRLDWMRRTSKTICPTGTSPIRMSMNTRGLEGGAKFALGDRKRLSANITFAPCALSAKEEIGFYCLQRE